MKNSSLTLTRSNLSTKKLSEKLKQDWSPSKMLTLMSDVVTLSVEQTKMRNKEDKEEQALSLKSSISSMPSDTKKLASTWNHSHPTSRST